MNITFNYIFYFLLFFIPLNKIISQELISNDSGQSLYGFSGLIFTPTAYTSNWGDVHLGLTHYDKAIALNYGGYGEGLRNERSHWAHIVFLPFAELSVKLTKPYNAPSTDFGLGDRSISFRFQLLKETAKRPAILIGVVDPFIQVPIFEARYIVLTKSFFFKNIQIISNLGYGLEVNKNNRNTDLQGLFGGFQLNWKQVKLNVEHDASHINVGTGYAFKNWLFFNAALVDLKHFSGSVHVRFSIK